MAATVSSIQSPWRSHPVVSASSGSSSFDDSSATTTAGSSPVRAATSVTDNNETQEPQRSSADSSIAEEFFAEPEWQRAPGRWKKSEEKLLREMKVLLADDLQRAKSQGVAFPEVVGSRRMLRFLRCVTYLAEILCYRAAVPFTCGCVLLRNGGSELRALYARPCFFFCTSLSYNRYPAADPQLPSARDKTNIELLVNVCTGAQQTPSSCFQAVLYTVPIGNVL